MRKINVCGVKSGNGKCKIPLNPLTVGHVKNSRIDTLPGERTPLVRKEYDKHKNIFVSYRAFFCVRHGIIWVRKYKDDEDE